MKLTIEELWKKMSENESQLIAELKSGAQELQDLRAKLDALEIKIKDGLGSLALLKGAKEIYTILMNEQGPDKKVTAVLNDQKEKPVTLLEFEDKAPSGNMIIIDEVFNTPDELPIIPPLPENAKVYTASSPPSETPRPPGGGKGAGGKKAFTRKDTKKTLRLRVEERIKSKKEGTTKGSTALTWLVENLPGYPLGIIRKDLNDLVGNRSLNRGEWENASRYLGWFHPDYIIRKDTMIKGHPSVIFTMRHWKALLINEPFRAAELIAYEPKEGIHYVEEDKTDRNQESTESDPEAV